MRQNQDRELGKEEIWKRVTCETGGTGGTCGTREVAMVRLVLWYETVYKTLDIFWLRQKRRRAPHSITLAR